MDKYSITKKNYYKYQFRVIGIVFQMYKQFTTCPLFNLLLMIYMYIYIYIYISVAIGEKTERLYFHPYKPVS